MENQPDHIDKLNKKLNALIDKHQSLENEIIDLRNEINRVDKTLESTPTKKEFTPVSEKPSTFNVPVSKNKEKAKPSRIKKDFEKFIGENLLNKIGIAITIIGVGIGAKYAIDNELFNPTPTMRVISGYLVGCILFFLAWRLKAKYEKFSAVLLSGAMTIFYFITFAAYLYYSLIPVGVTFTLMVLFTVFTVLSAIKYNQEIISIIGLVGAYAVPFLLSSGEGRYDILFSYMLIINIGILILAILRYWKILYHLSFYLTWLIYGSWFFIEFNSEEHFSLALLFSASFFLLFYMAFLSYKLLQKEAFNRSDIVLLFLNAFLFFGFGYACISSVTTYYDYLGIFTLLNALLHFIVALIVFKKYNGKNLFYFIGALVLTFLTITFPVEFDGNWVTLFWVGESALLFWIGRSKNLPIYEKLSYPLIILAALSQTHDWLNPAFYNPYAEDFQFTPIFNIGFISALVFCLAFAWINYLNYTFKIDGTQFKKKGLFNLMQVLIPGILLMALFFTGYLEIERYWEIQYMQSDLGLDNSYDYMYPRDVTLELLGDIWQMIFALSFVAILSFLNTNYFRDQNLSKVSIILNVSVLLFFLTRGLYSLGILRDYYFVDELQEHFAIGMMPLLIRYIAYIPLVASIYFTWRNILSLEKNTVLLLGAHLFIHLSAVWVLSSELVHWMDVFGNPNYKIGLSILWGIYALFMIVLGINKKMKIIRIGAFILFGITLIKLFFYDLQNLNTISKTIVFISLGVLLLIISFLYNKYKEVISDDEKS